MEKLRRISIIFLALIISVHAYNLTLVQDSELRIGQPVTAEIILNYNTTANETAQHNCYYSVAETYNLKAIVYSDKYNQLYPSSAQLQTDANGYIMYTWTPQNHIQKGINYTVTARCAGETATQEISILYPDYFNDLMHNIIYARTTFEWFIIFAALLLIILGVLMALLDGL